MKTKSKVILASLVGVVAVAIAVFFLFRDKNPTRPPRVGIFLYAQHPVIKEIDVGFRKGVDRAAAKKGVKVEYIVRNADGDSTQSSAIASYFRTADVDVILVAGLPAAQSLKTAAVGHPVVFAGVPDPIGAGLVPRLASHGTSFTGTRYFPPVAPTLDVFKQAYPQAKSLAVLHNPGEANSMALTKAFIAEAKSRTYEVLDLGASNATEIEAALRALGTNSPDGLYLPTDNLVYSSLDRILAQAKTLKIPVFSCTKLAVEKGAVFSVASDYEIIGELSGELAARIALDGQKPHDLDVIDVQEGHLYVNGKEPVAVNLKAVGSYSIFRVP